LVSPIYSAIILISNIGNSIATTINPTINPMTKIKIGSIKDVVAMLLPIFEINMMAE